jgi:hypothetical protein
MPARQTAMHNAAEIDYLTAAVIIVAIAFGPVLVWLLEVH